MRLERIAGPEDPRVAAYRDTATLRLPFARAEQWPGDLAVLRASGFAIVALTPREPSITPRHSPSAPRPAKTALLVGTEGAGLTRPVEAAADYRVRIPIASEIDSVNLAVAVGIALYRLHGSA